MIKAKLLKQFLVEPGTEVDLKDYVTDWTETDEAKELGKDVIKERAAEILAESRKQLAEAQELLYAATPTRCSSCFRRWTPPARTAPSATSWPA
jgi:hypothetical protein